MTSGLANQILYAMLTKRNCSYASKL